MMHYVDNIGAHSLESILCISPFAFPHNGTGMVVAAGAMEEGNANGYNNIDLLVEEIGHCPMMPRIKL